ncbi:U6 snRNA phosphodiesterase 1 [Anthonomus grandis grandis]|uniref:U6 snRNA phosphodiesterase 1 n=1 Tax=Anthonomus grandis grandis TaxID=2921223 RepID=UPI0021663F19|nr:U6 snRNA phosphodiesterase 1 [Anthonomus grandis grandis]XP_050301755.1 U6 snRNA phosphodiesterase 1 [Anthonomus grandis grandis]
MASKNSLSLLHEYGGDSSEDEVSGPRVSTKRTFREDEENPHSGPQFKRLPVPSICSNASKEPECIDDPSLHDGRVRSFPHERGNWATFVYIPFEATTGVTDLLAFIQEIVPENLDLKISDNFHISLTKTVVLKYHWITPFVQGVKENIKLFRKFFILFDSIQVYCNEERTRTFLGIQIKSGHDSLIKLVQLLDRCLLEYGLPVFYKDPSFHLSIAWCVGDKKETLQTYLPKINQKFSELMQSHPQEEFYIYVNSLLCKSGNKYFQLMLN